ncbi:alkanesulfonate monooxygenase SsuD/methylene tetrahydromethanopterin reductase-like flavin-dependent oxidoreductase (luciferase family), partial [Arthrobacter sp. AZCC_0090]|nr:alkanesulfonate monooxygenase SsuD/methylene tetrahydromethanopterin reductase-like flavin-dependent oxidoreductase (luciferase family) [Arthrobacter sp. AZCC_0090]
EEQGPGADVGLVGDLLRRDILDSVFSEQLAGRGSDAIELLLLISLAPSERLGRDPAGVHSPGHVAATDDQAIEEFWPHYETAFAEAARVRGFRPPTMQNFLHDVGPGGALYVGSPETVARKITETLKTLGASRFDLKYGMPGITQTKITASIELFGSQVAPLVRDMMA